MSNPPEAGDAARDIRKVEQVSSENLSAKRRRVNFAMRGQGELWDSSDKI